MGVMTMTTQEPPTTTLHAVYDDLVTPDGYRAEIIEGEIIVTPPPRSTHNLTFGYLIRALIKAVPDDMFVTNTQGVEIPATGDRVIPDLIVSRVTALRAHDIYLPPEDLLLVVEITSPSNARTDREKKARVYGQAGIALYLLLDDYDRGGHATLYFDPAESGYQDSIRVNYGMKLPLPEPFGFEIDTGVFSAPDER